MLGVGFRVRVRARVRVRVRIRVRIRVRVMVRIRVRVRIGVGIRVRVRVRVRVTPLLASRCRLPLLTSAGGCGLCGGGALVLMTTTLTPTKPVGCRPSVGLG